MMGAVLDNLHAEIAEHLDSIKSMFKDGAKVTLIVRNPNIKDADVLVTDDAPKEIVAALRRLSKMDPYR
jgi:hypothetical protein